MNRTTPALLLLAFLWGCTSRVHLEVPAAPAVALDVSSVAVVARDRECTPVADALIADLRERAQIHIDPRADIKLMVFGCQVDLGWALFHEVDAETASDRRRVDVEGRGHAVIAVTTEQGVVAHLIGSARDGHLGSWKNRSIDDMLRTRRAVKRRLNQSVAADLVQQLNPLPQQVARRIYPNASEGSARQLHSLAVHAELAGDLPQAFALAQAAHHEHPSPRAADYLASLQRRLYSHTDAPPPAGQSPSSLP